MKKGVKKFFRKGEKGFSLIEILFAILLLALVAAPICQTFITTAQTNARAKRVMAATDLAQATIEYITAQTYTDEVKTVFSDTASRVRIPSIGYTADGQAVTATDYTNFESIMKSTYASVNGTKAYISTWTNTNGENLATSMHDVEYDKKKYDVMVWFEPKKQTTTDQYFTYTVHVDVYLADGGHYSEHLVSAEGAIVNE